LLMSVIVLPLCMIDHERARHWPDFYQRLERGHRAQSLRLNEMDCWVASERVDCVQAIWSGLPNAPGADDTIRRCVQGWIQILGPVTTHQFAMNFSLDARHVFQEFIGLETQGLLMRGCFEHAAATDDYEIEWCERRILQRIHKLTVGARRRQIESIAPTEFMRWLLGWQHLALQSQVSGEDGLLEAIAKLEGFEAPAIEWERSIFPSRVANYDPRWLDHLCLSGVVGWGRVSPHPAFHEGNGQGPRRVIPTNASPITFYLRDSAAWLDYALRAQRVEERNLVQALTPNALNIWELLTKRGACFAEEIQRMLGVSSIEVEYALWELAAAGLAAADGFDQLRAMIDSDRRQAANSSYRKTRNAAGRWSLFGADSVVAKDAIEQARHEDISIESAAHTLLHRYGVVFRDLLVLESNIPRWSLLLRMFRRLEDRGQIRGGRFVSGFGGERFALPDVLDGLRSSATNSQRGDVIVAGADPMNLIGILIPGERAAAVPGRSCVITSDMLERSDATPLPGRQRSERRTSFPRPSAPRHQVPSLQAELI
jgi:ATP-dependent Lhr-like helicase